ncbi:hypothetical protein Q7C36_004174 [Tachysurus vachellii]|uniref:Uncharacterized protein n=1 Tax=Tachysurus vachellii TaxID=175792 RepID=A0AA88NLV9_TACVA|nr:hypothetical protein Q7C36_004174 [Tachysurus vachellii]
MVVYSLFNSVVLDLLLRHLLLVAGAAVVTVCIYYYVQRDDGGQTTEDTTVPEDPVYEQTTEPALVRHTEVVQDQMMECEREQEAHSILQNKYQEMKKTLMNKELLKEYKQEQEAHSIHHAEINESITHLEEENIEMKRSLIDQEELLKVTLAEAEEQHKKDMETITQLEEANSDLTERVEALRDTVETLRNIILQSSKKHNDLTNYREAHSIVQSEVNEMKKIITQLEEQNSEMKKTLIDKEYKQKQEAHSIHQAEINESITHLEEENIEMKRTLIDQVELMKVTLAEAEGQHQNNVQTITQLEEENSDLTERVEALRDTVETLGNIIFQSSKKHNNLTNERETHSIVQSEVNEMKKIITQLEEQNSEMKKTLIHKEELHKVALAEAEEKHQKDVETITQLEEENSDLTEKLEVLKETVEELGNVLFETNRMCDLLINEREAHSILQSENNEMKETIIQLEKDHSDLSQKVEILSDTVKELGKELFETHLQCDELTDSVSESERFTDQVQ